MDTIQLEYLAKVAELKSLSAAAQFYFTSYQNISRQIDKLEAEFGTKLLLRTNQGCLLTGVGEQVLEFGRRILNEYRVLRANLTHVQSVRLGIDKAFVHPDLIGFISDHPQLQIRLYPMDYGDLVDGLLCNQIDCLLGYANPHPKNVLFSAFSEDTLVVVTSPRHKLFQKQSFTYADLAYQEIFVSKFIWNRRQNVLDNLRQHAVSCKLLLDYDEFQLISHLYSGEAVALLPRDYLYRLTGDIAYGPLENETLQWGLYYDEADKNVVSLFRAYGDIFTSSSQ